MTARPLAGVIAGTELPPLVVDPISRTTLALFAGASGDHNPIHIDLDVARSAGLDDVFAQGMLSMAYLGRLLTQLGAPGATAVLAGAVRRDHPGARPAHLHRPGHLVSVDDGAARRWNSKSSSRMARSPSLATPSSTSPER